MPGLTDAEHALCAKLGQCAGEYAAILRTDVGGTLTTSQANDVNEFIHHIHDLQHAVMARAAIRAHPEKYRP